MRTEEQVKAYVDKVIANDPDLFVVDVEMKGGKGNQRLVVWMDGDKGIGIDQCASISRQLAAWLEETDLIKDKFFLEVSSSGMGNPLRLPRQYAKNQGRQVTVDLKSGEKLEGTIGTTDDTGFVLTTKDGEMKLAYADIVKTLKVVSFK
jgi:ribosome maturation factor RimP